MGHKFFIEKQDKIISSDSNPVSQSKQFWLGMGALMLIFLASIGLIVALHPTTDTDNKDAHTDASYVISPTGPSVDESSDHTSSVEDAMLGRKLYTVASVIDGDTIKIYHEGALISVRLIGVNTPETVDPRKSVECFGQEASDYLKKLLSGKQVSIETDPSQTDRDKYGRLLRYVYLDGEDINLKLIANGYGYEYTYNVPYTKQTEYKAAQAEAEAKHRGLWAPTACASNAQASNNAAASSNNHASTTSSACLHYEFGRCWDDLEDEAYSNGLYDQIYGYYGNSFHHGSDCDSICQDILEDAYSEGYYDRY